MLSSRLSGLALDERGFSLPEMLVALVMGVIVIGALFAILAVSLHQTAAISDNVQSNRQGRTVMTKIVNELHSACLAPDFTPVQTGSTATELRFVNAYSKEAVIPNAATSASEGAYEHRIKFEETSGGQGKLVDSYYPSLSSSSWPNFTFSTTASKTIVLGSAISQTSGAALFQYYKYGLESQRGTNSAVSTLQELTAPPEAGKVAAVGINFTAAPEDTRFQAPLASSRVAKEKIAFSNLVTFAFSAPNAETPVEAAPCE